MAAEPTASTTETCPACGATIDTSKADPLVRMACPQCGEKIRVQRAFNNFELVETLGIGGMGTVYKARDTLLDRFVALKLLRKDLGDEIDYATRLQQEARVAASVNHPNVIQVFSSGKDHGQFYLVMELVDHGSLDDLIEQKKSLPEELVLLAGIQVAKGLRAAQAKGLIHRDVKPANILFADEQTAKIGDFGLAGVAAETGETRNEIWGTPYYVAPERLYNRPEDFRSDIYSLGATLFHAISGRAPIEGDTNSATALRDLKNRPLDLKTVAPEVSDETAKVLQRTIAPEPLKRFGSYDELVAALETAYAKLTGREDLLTTRKNKMAWVAGVAVLLSALIGLGAWAYILRQHNRSEITAASARAERLVILAPLEGRATEAQRELSLNHFVKAKEAFARIAADSKGKQPIYDWALLQQGLAAMVGREPSQARQAFQDVERAGRLGFTNEDAGLATFFVETAKTLSAPGRVPATIKLDSTNYESFALFAYALKDIALSDVDDAMPLLDRFLNAKPAGKFIWIAGYKPLAQKYWRDCQLYVAWKKEGNEAKDPAGIARHEQNTHEIVQRKKLETRTVLSEEVFAAERNLGQQAADQQKTQSAARERERKKKAEQTVQQAAQLSAQKKPQWLSGWKKTLIDDLNRAHFTGMVTDRTGQKYSGILRATPDNLTMQLPYGEAQLPWAQLPPQTLLAISTSFIKPNAPDAADRKWLAAVFAAETGQPDAARKLAEEAAAAKPEYRDQLVPLLGPSPAPR
jgi:predicted RNA-binding Zn-ribbon protein involved in translation (DUF1610 family)